MSDKVASYSSVLGAVIANKRKELNLEQSVMAERMGLSQASYSRLESGKSTFSVDQMFDCAKALNIPVDKLFKIVTNTVNNLQSSNEIEVKAQPRGNTIKSKESDGSLAVSIIAGTALAALIFGLAGKSK